jgi:hypothetical protein
MARHLTLAAYTPEALAQLTRDPQDHSAAVREAQEASGGKLLLTKGGPLQAVDKGLAPIVGSGSSLSCRTVHRLC